jgi:hypothetical protein
MTAGLHRWIGSHRAAGGYPLPRPTRRSSPSGRQKLSPPAGIRCLFARRLGPHGLRRSARPCATAGRLRCPSMQPSLEVQAGACRTGRRMSDVGPGRGRRRRRLPQWAGACRWCLTTDGSFRERYRLGAAMPGTCPWGESRKAHGSIGVPHRQEVRVRGCALPRTSIVEEAGGEAVPDGRCTTSLDPALTGRQHRPPAWAQGLLAPGQLCALPVDGQWQPLPAIGHIDGQLTGECKHAGSGTGNHRRDLLRTQQPNQISGLRHR